MSLSTELYLVRHGQTEYNRRRIIQGREINSTLNQTGRQQVQQLGRRLAEIPFSAIYTSTLRRAEETAAILAKHHDDVPVYRSSDLEEMSWGIYEGKATTDEVLDRFEQIKDCWRDGVFEETVEGGETIVEVQERAIEAIDLIVERHAGEKVLVVTHGRLMRVLIATLLEARFGLERMHEVEHDNTGLNHLVFEGERCSAKLLNCLKHLEQSAQMPAS